MATLKGRNNMAINPLTGLEEEIDPITGQPLAPQAPKVDVQQYIKDKYGLGEKYSDQARSQLQEESGLGTQDRVAAALSAIGAGFQGRDSIAAGQNSLQSSRNAGKAKLDEFDKGRASKMQDFSFDRDMNKAQIEDDVLSRERDVDSQESKMADQLARDMGYKGGPVTAEQFKAFSPAMTKRYEIEQKKLDRQEARDERRFQQGVKMDEKNLARQDKLDKEAKPSEKQVKEFTDFDNALDSVRSIRAGKTQQDTGPLSSMQSDIAQKLGIDNADKSAFKAQVGEQLASYIKSISGAAVSDQERAFLLKNIPSLSDNDDTFNKKLDTLEARLEMNRNNHLKNTTKMGKNVKEFEREPNSQQTDTKQMNGKTYKKVAGGWMEVQ